MNLTILGIDPGTREMGLAVIRGPMLIAYGVRTLRNGERPYDVIGQARQAVLDMIRQFQVEVVAIEKPLRIATKRASLVTVITEELKGRSRELALQVVELSPEEVRKAVVGDPWAKKLTVARALVENGFPELRSKLPNPPKRAALGFRPGERYWLHMFDALAVAVAVARPSVASFPDGDFLRSQAFRRSARTAEP